MHSNHIVFSSSPLDPPPQWFLVASLSGASLRVLSKADNLRHLLTLRHAPELAVWHTSYTAAGDWDAGLARANAKAACKKPAPKRRVAQQRGGK